MFELLQTALLGEASAHRGRPVAGVIAGGITTALVTDALTYGEGGESGQPDSAEKELLALPEGGSNS